jgi:hypothetical protein
MAESRTITVMNGRAFRPAPGAATARRRAQKPGECQPGPAVVINADEEVTHARVVSVLTRCARPAGPSGHRIRPAMGREGSARDDRARLRLVGSRLAGRPRRRHRRGRAAGDLGVAPIERGRSDRGRADRAAAGALAAPGAQGDGAALDREGADSAGRPGSGARAAAARRAAAGADRPGDRIERARSAPARVGERELDDAGGDARRADRDGEAPGLARPRGLRHPAARTSR